MVWAHISLKVGQVSWSQKNHDNKITCFISKQKLQHINWILTISKIKSQQNKFPVGFFKKQK